MPVLFKVQERERERERQTDRTDRQTGRQTGKLTDKQRERERGTARQREGSQTPHLAGFVCVQDFSLDNEPQSFPLLVFSHPQVAAHV